MTESEEAVAAATGPFVPADFDVPASLVTDRFRLEPLAPHHNERDFEAWTSSLAHIHATPGYEESRWPVEMSLDDNLGDMEMHARHFTERSGFTYSVLEPDAEGDAVIGCVYIYPDKAGEADAEVRSWVRASRAELDVELWRAVSVWLDRDWPFETVRYAPR